MYCGDYKKLPTSYTTFGTRNECLRKGIGVGKYMSESKKDEIKRKYSSISQQDRVKIYCGNKNAIPDTSYKRMGTRNECLKRGVGIGARIELNQDEIEDVIYQKLIEISNILHIRSASKKSKDKLIETIIDRLNSF